MDGLAPGLPPTERPEAMDVPTPWDGGDGDAINDPERKKSAKLAAKP